MIHIFLESPNGDQDQSMERFILEKPTISIEFEEEDAVYKKSDVSLKLYDPNRSFLNKILYESWFLRIVYAPYFDMYFVYANHHYDYKSKELEVTFFDIRLLLEDAKTNITDDVSDEIKEEWIKDEHAARPIWQVINFVKNYGFNVDIDSNQEIMGIEFKKWAVRYYIFLKEYYGEVTLSEFITDIARTFRSFYFVDGKTLRLVKKNFLLWPLKNIKFNHIIALEEQTDADAKYSEVQIEYDYFNIKKKQLEAKSYPASSQGNYKKIHLKFVSAFRISPIETANQIPLNTIIQDIYRKYMIHISNKQKQIVVKVAGLNYSPLVAYKVEGYEIGGFYYPIRMEYDLKENYTEIVLRLIKIPG